MVPDDGMQLLRLDLGGFTRGRGTGRFVLKASELSSLQGGALAWWVEELRETGVGLAIEVRDQARGRIDTFRIAREDHDDDGVRTAWHFVPAAPGCAVRGITILADWPRRGRGQGK
jgi:hypothetical protein